MPLAAFAIAVQGSSVPAPLHPDRLRCEALLNPLGVDVARPRLSWIVVSDRMGQRQTAFRLRVASDPRRLASGRPDLWDSGRTASDETRDIVYRGRPLKPGQRVFWNVQVWDKDDRPSRPSAPATWTTHLIGDPSWKPRWIGMFDRPFPRKGIGYHASEAKSLDETKWVQVDLGRPTPLDSIVLDRVRNHLEYPVFGFPVRYKVEGSNDPDMRGATTFLDHTGADDDPSRPEPVKIPAQGAKVRYIRVTATRLFRRKDGVGCFALAEIEARSGGKDVAVGKPVTAQDSVEHDGWTREALTDGWGDESGMPITLLLRKEAILAKPIRRAVAYVSGLGQYQFRINGRKAGQDWITPGWTQYRKSVLVDAYDVTGLLHPGRNAFAFHLGNGMYDMRTDTRGSQQTNSLGIAKALCRIRIEYADGTVGYVDSDGTWSCAPGPETYSGVFGGEDWDARLEPEGWDRPGFAGKWRSALVVTPPEGKLRGVTHAAPPMRVAEVRTPAAATRPKPDTLVLDLGQNAPYVPRIQVRGPRGSTLRMWPAEMLKPDGTVEQSTMRAGKLASYTLGGKGVETWNPVFWYVGSRYWQVQAFDPAGRPIDPSRLLRKFQGLLVHGSEPPAGTFECSSALFNRTAEIVRWAMLSNFASVISDCPHREKSGWLEQDQLNAPGLMYCFDMSAMFRKVVDDMHDTQLPNGMVPTMAPEYFIYDGGFRDSIEWGGTYLFLPRYMRDWYANDGLIGEHYDAMRRYVEYLRTVAKDGILSNGLGDWDGGGNDPRTPVAITDTAYYYLAAKTLSEFAGSLGKAEDARRYAGLAQAIRNRFRQTFFDPATGKVGTGSQSAQATALDLGLLDAADRPKAFAALMADVAAQHYAVSCGEVGHPSLLRVLAANGRSDVVAKIHSQTEKRGYGFQIEKGLTTLAETWDAATWASLNHFMLGHIVEWFYADLAGIRPDPAKPGFRGFVVQPQPVPRVTWAKATYDSIRGKIACSWKIEGGRIALDVTVPANTTATIWVPTNGNATVREGAAGARPAGRRPGYQGFAVVSGRFRFEAPFFWRS